MKTFPGALMLAMLLSMPLTAAEPAKIIPPPQCQTDADCGPCVACVNNMCQGFGVLECTVDTDCGVDEYCQVDDVDSCKNHCVSNQCMLVFCMQECDPWYGPECPADQVCEQSIKGCCGQCVKPLPGCASDADCDACSSCLGGACVALPKAPDCTADTDCGVDEYCITYPGAECRNRCASKTCWVVDCAGDCEPVVNPCGAGQTCVEPIPGCCGTCEANPACASNADCGACQVCVNGQCQGLGVVECFDDADCVGDFRCQVYAGEECKNHCVDKTCDLLDCMAECDPYFTPCPAGQVCVEPYQGCCGQCQAAECATDADCGACAACMAGTCMGLGDISCASDSDCAEGETCAVDAANPCLNHCVPGGEACVVDYDCAPCQACVDGLCTTPAPTGCLVDSDCDAGFVCVQGLPGDCENHCEPIEAPCASDADCGACQVCSNGQCVGLGLVECNGHADCGADEYCHQVLGEACKNACEALPEGGCRGAADCAAGSECVMLPDGSGLGDCVATSCADDTDCGACGVCVNGTCEGTGLVVCAEDGDCGAGKRCEVDAEAPCKNACVPAGAEPDATTGDSTSPDTVQPDAAGEDAADDTTKEPTGDKTGGDCSFTGFDRASGSSVLLVGILLLGLALRRRQVAG